MAVVIPFDGKDPLKYLYRTIHQWHLNNFDVYVVDTSFFVYPPYVKRIKQKTPGISGARYDGFKEALKEGYDCVINSDSHVILEGDPHALCNTPTFSGAYHHPWEDHPVTMTVSTLKIYASVVYPEDGKIMWCTYFTNPGKIPMTSEPIYGINAKALEEVIDKVTRYTTYGLDNVWLYYITINRGPGVIADEKKFHFYHLGIITRLKPPARRPSDNEAQRFIQEMGWTADLVPQSPQRLCWPIWTPQPPAQDNTTHQ